MPGFSMSLGWWGIAMSYQCVCHPQVRALKIPTESFRFVIFTCRRHMHGIKQHLNHLCCIFWPAFGCYTLLTLVEIYFFIVLVLKSWKRKKKQEICCKFSKKMFFIRGGAFSICLPSTKINTFLFLKMVQFKGSFSFCWWQLHNQGWQGNTTAQDQHGGLLVHDLTLDEKLRP